MIEATIENKPSMSFVGMEQKFISCLSPDSNNMELLGPLWGRFLPLQDRVPNRVNAACYGVMKEIPEDERSHPHELLYMAAAAVSSTDEVPPGMVARVVPELTYAVFIHRGDIGRIRDTIDAVYSEWLPNSRYQHTGIADIELYDERFKPGSPDSEMEYWVSVKPQE